MLYVCSGYWKDTGQRFENYIACDGEWDGIEDTRDLNIFFYTDGLPVMGDHGDFVIDRVDVNLKPFEVTLEYHARRTFTVIAENKKSAENQAKEMANIDDFLNGYLSCDTENDVEEIDAPN
jgi:hypothetical protein